MSSAAPGTSARSTASGVRPAPSAGAASGRPPTSLLVSAAVAGLLALLFLVLAVVASEPGRHAHGLLVVVDLAGVVGVGVVWLRVVRLLSLSAHRGRVE